MCASDLNPIFDLYGRYVVSSGVLDQVGEQAGLRSRKGIYSLAVVLWLMIWQRLQPRGTMSAAVQQLVQGNGRSLLRDCKRVREKRISPAAGGYCQSVGKVPTRVAQLVTSDVVARLSEELTEAWPGLAGPVYVLDGSTLQLEHTRKLVRAYPTGHNQRGAGHWPILRMVVAHELSSGMALYPQWGPFYGDEAVSEQGLAAQVLQQMRPGTVVIADRNFGVFAVAWEAAQRGCGVIVRLTQQRAVRLCGQAISCEQDRPVVWRPGRWNRPQLTAWPEDASLAGRLVAARVGRGKHKQWLYLFVTVSLPVAEVVSIYGRRWNIETDLRSLKQTVHLQHPRSRSVEALQKELLTAVCAYNFVRAVMCLAARRAGIEPRSLSFTRVLDVANCAWPRLIAAPSQAAHDEEFAKVLDWAAACKLPRRSKRRHYPREVWGHGYRFPAKKTK